MKVFKGSPINIGKPIIGKVSTQAIGMFKSKRNVILSSLDKIQCNGYCGYVYKSNMENLEKKYCKDVPTLIVNPEVNLNDGDVISITPDGKLNVLYDRNSAQNAIFATDRCNFSCIMCPQDISNAPDNRTEENLKLISLIDKHTKHLAITGGEPTLIGDNLFIILEACKKHLPTTSITLLTNALRFEDFEFAKRLALVCHPNLTVAIPLYADTDTQHNEVVGTKGFYKTIQGIYNLARFGIKIEIRTVIIGLNYKRLLQFSEFIYRNLPFVIHVAFMGVEYRHKAKTNLDKLWIDPVDYAQELSDAIYYLDQRKVNVSIYNHQLCVVPMPIRSFARQSISSWKNGYIDECNECILKQNCCGFFTTSEGVYSKHIQTIKNQ